MSSKTKQAKKNKRNKRVKKMMKSIRNDSAAYRPHGYIKKSWKPGKTEGDHG